MNPIEWVVNTMPKTDDKNLSVMALDEIGKARKFHESFPQYSKTPLAKLDHMAEYLGLGQVYVKDESYRFGLNAFKVLGGSFAIAKYIAQQTGKDVSDLPYSVLTSEELRKEFGQATFFTATDGNHGRGVAWAANRLGQKAVVFMPKGSTITRFNNIKAEGAEVTIEEVNYDECVRMAADAASKTEHGVVVQDTAWDGYEEIPAWIMQGYGTMAMEAGEQLEEYGCVKTAGRRRFPCRSCTGLLCKPLSGESSQGCRCRSRCCGLSLQGRESRRRRHSDRRRRYADHHGRFSLRRAEYHLLGYFKESRRHLRLRSRLGSGKRHENAGGSD